MKILDREIANLEKKAGKTVDTAERERLRGELEYKIAERDGLARRNVQPVLLAQDATTKRVTAMVEEQGEVLFSASWDCRKVVDNLMGRYSANKSTDESFYLAGYSGDRVRVDHGSRPPVNLRRPCLGLLWFGQPDLVESMLAADSLRASSFLPRLLLCHSHAVPQARRGRAGNRFRIPSSPTGPASSAICLARITNRPRNTSCNRHPEAHDWLVDYREMPSSSAARLNCAT